MRAISLGLTAFGPYKEKQLIDFSQLGEETLFLITGPTGAGKTTIFDAMCFALYGKASGDDRDHDTLRSHFAGEDDFTEVTFRFAIHQKEFEIIRSPKQNKRKSRGEGFTEQPPQAELYEIINGARHLIYAKVKDVNEAIEDMLQLDYEQFRKMVMIPQGEFRRLISENSREREEILQKIFRTYFYDQITKKLAEESKSLQHEIEQLDSQEKHELTYVNWPDEYNVQDVDSNQALIDLKKLIENDKKEVKAKEVQLLQERKEWNEKQKNYFEAKELLNKFMELEQLDGRLKDLLKQKDNIQAEKQILQKARDASQIKGYEIQVRQRKQEYNELETSIKNLEVQLKETLDSYQSIERNYQTGEKEEQNREALKEALRKMKEEYEKQKQAHLMRKNEKELSTKYQAQLQIVNQFEENAKKQEEQISKIDEEIINIQQVTEQYYEFREKKKTFDQLILKGKALNSEVIKLKQLRVEYKVKKAQFDDGRKKANQLTEELQELEAKQRQEQAAVLATQLMEGQACPVCGSFHHPQKAQFHDSSVTDEAIQNKRKQLDTQNQWNDKLQQLFIDITSLGQSQNQTIEKLEDELSEQSGLSITTENVESRLQDWSLELQRIVSKSDQLEQQLTSLKAKQEEQNNLKKTLMELRNQLQEKHQALQNLKDQKVKLQSHIEQLVGELKHPIEDLQAFEQKIIKQENEYKEIMDAWKKLQQDFEQIKELKNRLQIETQALNKQLSKARDALEIAKSDFDKELRSKQFSSTDEYLNSKLDEFEVKALDQKIKSFEDNLTITQNSFDKLSNELSNKNKPEVEELERVLKVLSDELDEKAKILQQQQLQIDRHEIARKKLEQIIHEKKALEAKYFDIGELAKLSRGDNQLRLSFERYVLSSFLDEILFQANIRLDRMTDHRYQLRRSDQIAKRGAQSGLDLEVIDYYTGQERSVKTLSGGEGFKAALSLALGMADVVQAHSGGVELDTLFIDEGFGTLDELSLEQALDCLSELQKGNRMLGIISHVPKLKEEIRAKLNIVTSHSGSKVSLSLS